MASKTLNRVLVIQTAFLGDAVLATGILEKIHTHFAEARIDILIRKGNESLFEKHPFLNEVLVFEKRRSKYRNLVKLIFKVYSKKYDLVVNIQRYFTTGLITVLSAGTITIGFDKNPLSFLFTKKIKHEFKGSHEIIRNHSLIEWFTDDEPARPVLYPSESNDNNVSGYTSGKFITLSPASVWATKQYPKERWIEIINFIPVSTNVYLLGGPSDREICEYILINSSNDKVFNLAGNLSLLDTAALMSRSALNIVNDSAPMHISSSVNAPTCSIYCSTIPAFGYGPLSDKSEVIEISGELYCRPCGIHGRKKCPEKHFRCAWDIRMEEIQACIIKYLDLPE
jgi:heptosyltransferase-2